MKSKTNEKQVQITLSVSGITEFLSTIPDKYKKMLLLRLRKWESEKKTGNDENMEIKVKMLLDIAKREWKKKKGFKYSLKYHKLIAPKIQDPDYGFGICQKVIEKKAQNDFFIENGFLRIQTVFGPNFDAYVNELLKSELDDAALIDEEIKEKFNE